MNAKPLNRVRIITDDRGSTLVIVVIFLPVLILLAAFAIDASNWYVHHSHLQTQADAAALAAAQDFQFPCTPAIEEQIATDVHHYDGTQTGTGNYNQQVPSGPPHGGAEYKVSSLINAPNFFGQSTPNDTINASPCKAGAIDVKVTEANLPWYLQALNVAHINAQARVSIENLTSVNSGLSPLAEPLPTPNAMTAYLIDEGNQNAILASVNLSPVPKTNNASWTATDPSFTFNAVGPVGMEIAEGGGASPVPCENANGNSCYDAKENIGLTYTRVWSHPEGVTPGQPAAGTPAAPQIDDASFDPTSTTCPNSGTFSNFISTSATCTVALKVANVQFAEGTGAPTITCSNAGLTVKAETGTKTQTQTLTCPTATPLNGHTWTSGAISVEPSSLPTSIKLGWTLQAGKLPAGASGGTGGVCGDGKTNGPVQDPAPCTGTFGVVQRIFSGAYDSQSATSSNSGGVLAATLTNTVEGGEIQSTPKSTTATSVAINVNVVSFQNSQAIPSSPVELSFGGNQANAAISCPGLSAGGPQLEKSIVSGCVPPNNNFELDSNFTSEPCNPLTDPATEAELCLPENPGTGKLEKVLDDAMNTKINGSKNAKCTHFNYWAPENKIPQLLHESPPDRRLLTVLTTDYGALGNGRTEVPIRAFADFYVTGWAGDPCVGHANGVSSVGQTTGGEVALNYTGDEAPSPNTNGGHPEGVLLGHFVQYTALSTGGTGSGQCQESTSLGNCIAILTK